jgi:hypothetical protein
MISRLFAALILLCLAAMPVQAQKTKAALTTEINTNWPDNTSGAITPAILRSTILDIVNSYFDLNGATSLSCAAHQWVAGLPTLSSITCVQPAFSDISGQWSLTQGPTLGANTVLCSVAGGTPIACTRAQLTAMLNLATAALQGALPAWPNNTTTFFRGDGTYDPINFAALPAGTSDTMLGYWGSTVVSATAVNNCTGALTYSTSTHTFGCNTGAGAGSVTQIIAGTANVSGTCTTSCQTVKQTAPAAWTPTDASGASLTFSSVSANYTQIGNMVFAYAAVAYPSTASSSNAAIGGLPVIFVSGYGLQCTINYESAALPLKALPTATENLFVLVNDATGTQVTNAQLSGSTVIFQCIYPAN